MTNKDDEHADTSPNFDKSQDNIYWLNMWRNRQIKEFHQTQVNKLLVQCWNQPNVEHRGRVLVPLCGKSLDMIWLSKQGYQVIGIELSPIAVKSFFKENQIKVKKVRHGNYTVWQSSTITVWCGDYFSLKKSQLGKIDFVLDRAALTALPTEIRGQYIDQLHFLIHPNTSILL